MKCECGCGKEAKKGNKFIQGHNDNLYGMEWNILSAIHACDSSNYVEDSEIAFLSIKTIDPEKVLIKKESYQGLSDEAKYVIDICLNAPVEIMNQIKSPKFGVISRNSLLKYFRTIWKRKKTLFVFKEVSDFVNNF